MARAGASRLEQALSELRATPPREFTRTRNALAAALAKEGLKNEATAVKRARKPPASAWAVAALARNAPHVLERVLNAGAELLREQRRAVSGAGAGSLREATRGFHEAIAAAVRAAEDQLRSAGERPSAPVMERVRLTLLASAEAPDEARAALSEGSLEEDLSPTGFGDARAQPTEKPLRAGRQRAAERADAERQRLQQEKQLEEERTRRRRLLQIELQRLERALRTAEDEERRLERIAQAMEQRARAARERANAARSKAEEARRARDEAKRKLPP